MKKRDSQLIQTPPSTLVTWSRTPLARAQRRTGAALKGLDSGAKERLVHTRDTLIRVVTAPIRFDLKFEPDPSAALCLVVVDRALGGGALPVVDRLVDAAFREHGGDLIRMARALLDDLERFSQDFALIHGAVPLSEYEGQFSRHALEHAEFEWHDRFVAACELAAEYLGDDLRPKED